MPKRIALSTLNASTIDILNAIWAQAPNNYQDQVPEVKTAADIPKVGEVILGYPAFANHFASALMNRIAMVRVESANFNNLYKELKKGKLQFGETVESVFVAIAQVRTLDPTKVEQRELKRTLPDISTQFHAINWRVQYPVTIEMDDLQQAFLSMDGVQDLIARIVDQIYVAAEYDEYLLFKYLMIKAISHGDVKPIYVGADTANLHDAATQFRGASNLMTFMRRDFNRRGKLTTTKKEDQYIFLDAVFDAKFDVENLSAAFNMDKATYMGHRFLIDDWTSFDNERWEQLRAESDCIEEVTADELALMKDVRGAMFDKEWFQIYDVRNNFTEKFLASGEAWNYFYNVVKTVSRSDFSNAVVFVGTAEPAAAAKTFDGYVASSGSSEDGGYVALNETFEDPAFSGDVIKHVQTEAASKAGVGVREYGGYLFPKGFDETKTPVTPTIEVDGVQYVAAGTITPDTAPGTALKYSVPADPEPNPGEDGG